MPFRCPSLQRITFNWNLVTWLRCWHIKVEVLTLGIMLHGWSKKMVSPLAVCYLATYSWVEFINCVFQENGLNLMMIIQFPDEMRILQDFQEGVKTVIACRRCLLQWLSCIRSFGKLLINITHGLYLFPVAIQNYPNHLTHVEDEKPCTLQLCLHVNFENFCWMSSWTASILSLCGLNLPFLAGDWHMAYICMYKARLISI